MTDAKISIVYTGYTGNFSTLSTEEIALACEAINLPTTKPPALEIHDLAESSDTVLAKPTLAEHPGFLYLNWEDKGRKATANFMAFLLAKGIAIPKGTRFVIDVRFSANDYDIGPCLELSWDKDSFVPVDEQTEAKSEPAGVTP